MPPRSHFDAGLTPNAKVKTTKTPSKNAPKLTLPRCHFDTILTPNARVMTTKTPP